MYKILHMQEENERSMNRNDMRSVVYLIIALIAFYFLMDDFIGKNKISNWVNNFIGGFGGELVPPAKTDTQTQAAGGAAATAPATQPSTAPSQNLSPNPLPLIPEKKPSTQPQTKPKSGSAGWSLNDLIPHWSLPQIPFGLPAVVAGETLAIPSLLRKAYGG